MHYRRDQSHLEQDQLCTDMYLDRDCRTTQPEFVDGVLLRYADTYEHLLNQDHVGEQGDTQIVQVQAVNQ